MKWAMYLKTDAVLTNNPEKYLALRDHVPTEHDQPENWLLKEWLILYIRSWVSFVFTTLRVWRFSGRGGWKEKLGNVEEKGVKSGVLEKIQEIQE
jgi:hypothetical protein